MEPVISGQHVCVDGSWCELCQPNEPDSAQTNKSRKRILFVDDEPHQLNGLRRMLRGQDHAWEMCFVLGADEALDLIHAVDFDAMVLDVRMPGRDGFDLLRELQTSERTREVPVIMLTGVGDDELKCLALNQGATDLLTKPVSLEDLLARIRSVLRLKAYQDELKGLNRNLEQRVAERTEKLENSRLDIIWRLAKAGEYRDETTGNHVARVGCYSQLLGQELRLPADFVETLFLTAPLHDIGKIGLPDSILLKPGELTTEERQAMQKHCVIGAEILRQEAKGQRLFLKYRGSASCSEWTRTDNRLLNMAVAIALGHHERWDGRGYPAGLAGEDIPVEARIVALADVYDALCYERPYKPALPEEKVLTILNEEAGHHFDPAVYGAFEKLIEAFRDVRSEFADEVCVV